MNSSDNISDKEIVTGIKAGDKASYRLLFARYYSRVRNVISHYTNDLDKAEDIAQSLFIKVWLYRDRLDPDRSIKNFLYISARNKALDALRDECKRPTDNLPLDCADTSTSGYDIEYLELETIIKNAIQSMPEQRRKIFMMSRIEHLSDKEIAAKTGLSVRTVEKHLELARRDLRKEIEGI